MIEIEQACIGAVAQSNSCTRWEAGPGLRPRHTEEHRDTVCVQVPQPLPALIQEVLLMPRVSR